MAEKQKDTQTEQAPQRQVAAVDEVQERGFFGTTPETTPNEAFTLKGVTSGSK